MFIKSLRRLFIAACIFLVVDSPSSPSSLSISSTSEIQKPWSFPLLGPSVNLESEVNDTHVLDDITLFAVDYSIFAVDDFDPSIHEIPHNIARVMTPFQIDFSDLDINVLEMMVPAVCAITHTIRKNPTMVVTTIVVEGVKLVLKLGGLEAQVGLGLGEEVEKLDKLLASTVLRLAIDLVLGTLAVLFSRKRCRRAVKVFGRHAREVDGWLAEHVHRFSLYAFSL
ncbi:hypothetical protein FB451DRAFT_711300 [Mycena latifolia]|nr:hypothetical protein FB451DRAFT_711300 [Mycena latifolia]